MNITTAHQILKASGFNVCIIDADKGQFCCQSFVSGKRVYASCYQNLKQGCLITNGDDYHELPMGTDIVQRVVLEALRRKSELVEACVEPISA